MRFSTIFTVLFFPYIAHERTAQNLILSVRSSLFLLLSAIAPKMQVRSRAKSDFKEQCAQLCPYDWESYERSHIENMMNLPVSLSGRS